MMSHIDLSQLLYHYQNKYIIGIYQEGITVYKQQIRALNIFYALYKEKILNVNDPSYTIGIIGGGVAGLTFAAAALEAGFKVVIFEKKPIYLHMQFGCDIRKIHPNLYEWPDKKYINPYAELPILDWKYDSAANVVKQVVRGWESVRKSVKSGKKKPGNLLTEILSCSDIKISKVKVNKKNNFLLDYETDEEAGPSVRCDLLIYATGYGIERGVEEVADTPSYWRNDYYSQIELHAKEKLYIISGVGDGGLIDLFRLKIFDFSYELILEIIEKHKDYSTLLPELQRIKIELHAEKPKAKNAMFNKFSSLNPDEYKYIYDELRTRDLIRDNKIWLNDFTAKFSDTLDYKKMSFLHAFLIFILMQHHKKIGLTYQGGALVYDKANESYTLNGEAVPKPSTVIIRHGTDRDNSLPVSYFKTGDATLSAIKKRQEKEFNHTSRWSNADLISIFKPGSTKKYEYINPATSVLCANYLTSIANLLKSYNPQRKSFRVALYRVIYTQGNYVIQQITAFFGSRQTDGNKSIGQVFPFDWGMIGASFSSGHPIHLVNNNDQAFETLINNMGMDGNLASIKEHKSFLTLPILAHLFPGSQKTVNLVLYADSTDMNFFVPQYGKDDILSTISALTNGFIEAINHHIKFKELTMVPVDFQPLAITDVIPDIIVQSPCFINVCDTYPHFKPSVTKLLFNEFYSFTQIT